MKTFWKITLMLWALTVCIGGQDSNSSHSVAKDQQILAEKTTHSCEVKEASQPRQKA
ncbi:hypothetical protein [Algoriphagus alkaliphilus]|uniref:hypothetical protein n=1 Tax=Algoriphagus alkaliphilus TaxID=279824 RepID=UPI0015873EA7|nr:hypothetical protein [Algoriphagus alkaliphilus]